VLALLHHADDPYASKITNTDQNSKQERKAAHKNMKVVQFTGTLPAPPPVVIPFRIHAAAAGKPCDVYINLQGYRGRARLYIPKLKVDGDLKDLADGLAPKNDFKDFKRWAGAHETFIKKNQAGDHPYNKVWAKQRLANIADVLKQPVMFVAGARKLVGLRRIVLAADEHQTLFLVLDRPADGRIGEHFDLQIVQRSSEDRQVLGGLDLRIELQPEPKKKPKPAPERVARGRKRPIRNGRREPARPVA
jgi:hypothetical protein